MAVPAETTQMAAVRVLCAAGWRCGRDGAPRVYWRRGAILGVQLLQWLPSDFWAKRHGNAGFQRRQEFSDDQLAKMAVSGINFCAERRCSPGNFAGAVARGTAGGSLSGSLDDVDVRRVLTYVVRK